MATSSDVNATAAKYSQNNLKSIGISNDSSNNSSNNSSNSSNSSNGSSNKSSNNPSNSSPNNPSNNPSKDLLTREAAINGYQQIEKIRAEPGQGFCVVAYFLSNEIGPDGCHGLWYFIGTFSSADQAKDKAIELIEKTGIRSIYAMQTCSWQEINDKFAPDRIKLVPTDKRGKLRQQHEKEYQELSEQYEREKEIREELEEELTRESDSDSLEYYIQQWYRTIKNTALVEKLEADLKEIKNQLEESKDNLHEAYQKNPDHEKNWIPQLEDRLPKRGEEQLLEALKMGADKLREEILKS